MRSIYSVAFVLICLLCSPAFAVKIADITHIGGQRTNELTGLGLVFGLKGSGDGGDFMPAVNMLAAMLSKFQDTSAVKNLSAAANVAVVSLTATVPADGVRDGDQLDVYVTSIGAATNLKGGRLFITPMSGPIPGSDIYAMSHGAVEVEDASEPTSGVIKGGCVMEVDWKTPSVNAAGKFTLVIEGPAASWTTASLIAKVINDSADNAGDELAVAADQKTVVVTIPAAERLRPDGFISRIEQLPVPVRPTEARVQINKSTGTLIMTGDVEISPVVISHKGLTISTIAPPPVPSARNPVVSTKDIVSVDTTNEGGARLQDLVNALDAIKVPVDDRIDIIMELYKTGKIHAKLITE